MKKHLPHIAILGFIMTMTGFILGKSLLAAGVGVLTACSLLNDSTSSLFQKLKHDRLVIGAILCYFVYLISGLWSKNLGYYTSSLNIHLPLLLIPIASIYWRELDTQLLKKMLQLFILCILLGTFYSVYHIIRSDNLLDLYHTGKSALTPFKNDYVRFSLAVVISIIGCHYLWMNDVGRWRGLIVVVALWLIIYLHILAAKSGLICVYLYLLIWLIRWIRQGKVKYATILFCLLFLSPIAAYFTSKTFRAKINYLQYSLQQIKNQNEDTYISDEGRLISYQLALDIWNKNKLLGVGAGDIKDEMDNAYKQKISGMDLKTLLPHNQFLVFALVGGIIGLAVFLYFVSIPFFDLAYRRSGIFASYAIMQILPLMIEPMYEAQISITLILFFLFFYRILDLRSQGSTESW